MTSAATALRSAAGALETNSAALAGNSGAGTLLMALPAELALLGGAANVDGAVNDIAANTAATIINFILIIFVGYHARKVVRFALDEPTARRAATKSRTANPGMGCRAFDRSVLEQTLP
jgi:hypothetical protein